jgi:hypothetical protein
MNVIFGASNTIFLLDELDKGLDMRNASSGEDNSHETTIDTVGQMLEAFEDDADNLLENNVFVIATTNEVGNLNEALVSRAMGNLFSVEGCKSKECFEKFLDTMLATQRAKHPHNPWLLDPEGGSYEDHWNYTERFFRENIDVSEVADAIMAMEGAGFREIEGLLSQMLFSHKAYESSLAQIGRGETDTIDGMPLTTENFVQSMRFIQQGADPKESNYGTTPLKNAKADLLNDLMQSGEEGYSLTSDDIQRVEISNRSDEFKDAFEGLSEEEVKSMDMSMYSYQVSDELLMVMNGQTNVFTEATPQETDEEVSGFGDRARMRYRTRGQEMEESAPESIEEVDLGNQQDLSEIEDEGVPQERAEDEEERDPATSSTDYLLDVLLKEGFSISEDGSSISYANKEVKETPQQGNSGGFKELSGEDQQKKLEDNGVYYLNFKNRGTNPGDGNDIFIGPIDPDQPMNWNFTNNKG